MPSSFSLTLDTTAPALEWVVPPGVLVLGQVLEAIVAVEAPAVVTAELETDATATEGTATDLLDGTWHIEVAVPSGPISGVSLVVKAADDVGNEREIRLAVDELRTTTAGSLFSKATLGGPSLSRSTLGRSELGIRNH
jgi:hypothetical protein